MGIIVRDVWSDNLEKEFVHISKIVDDFSFASFDTEFPGTIYEAASSTPDGLYAALKRNVDETEIIQLGITLSDSNGNLPMLDSKKDSYIIWQFNFLFDPAKHRNNPDSIVFLTGQGINFPEHLTRGIDSKEFATLMISSGLILRGPHDVTMRWFTFECKADFGYLLKILTQEPLPSQLAEFLDDVQLYFGTEVYDIKYMSRFVNRNPPLHGGLESMAVNQLGIRRAVGTSHTAGSDSLLTWHLFLRIWGTGVFDGNNNLQAHAGCLNGLSG